MKLVPRVDMERAEVYDARSVAIGEFGTVCSNSSWPCERSERQPGIDTNYINFTSRELHMAAVGIVSHCQHSLSGFKDPLMRGGDAHCHQPGPSVYKEAKQQGMCADYKHHTLPGYEWVGTPSAKDNAWCQAVCDAEDSCVGYSRNSVNSTCVIHSWSVPRLGWTREIVGGSGNLRSGNGIGSHWQQNHNGGGSFDNYRDGCGSSCMGSPAHVYTCRRREDRCSTLRYEFEFTVKDDFDCKSWDPDVDSDASYTIWKTSTYHNLRQHVLQPFISAKVRELLDGTRVFGVVRAYTVKGDYRQHCTNGVVVDTSPPEYQDTAFVGYGFDEVDTTVISTNRMGGLAVWWRGVYEHHSIIDYYEVRLSISVC
jgi:hypothetical protein